LPVLPSFQSIDKTATTKTAPNRRESGKGISVYAMFYNSAEFVFKINPFFLKTATSKKIRFNKGERSAVRSRKVSKLVVVR
jgi:hypothetical protein